MLDISWSNVLESNAFNFTIMVIFFAVLIKYLKVPEGIEADRTNIQKNVELSDEEKRTAQSEFHQVEKSLENLPDELDKIIKNADVTAKAFENKSKEEIEMLVESIKENAQKQVGAQEKQTQSLLMKNIGKSSVEIAQKQVKNAFEQNKDLHRKFINDFINSLDKETIK